MEIRRCLIRTLKIKIIVEHSVTEQTPINFNAKPEFTQEIKSRSLLTHLNTKENSIARVQRSKNGTGKSMRDLMVKYLLEKKTLMLKT